jgi:hypothetical protein
MKPITITLTLTYTPEDAATAASVLGCDTLADFPETLAEELISTLEYDSAEPSEWDFTATGLPAAPEPDFTVSDHGTIVLVRPSTAAGNAHLASVVPEDAQWFGDALAVEPRFLGPLIQGLQDEGFTVSFTPFS